MAGSEAGGTTLGVYLVTAGPPRHRPRAEALAKALPDYMSRATGGRMTVTLQRAVPRR